MATTGDKAWAVSPVGVLVRSPDREGVTWRVVKTGVPAWLRSVSFADDRNGWIAGDRNAARPEWYCGTKAAGYIHPRDVERFGAYETGIKRSLNRLLQGREKERLFDNRFGRYGLRNFGDNFGSDGMNWDNVEYDLEHDLRRTLENGAPCGLRSGEKVATSHRAARQPMVLSVRGAEPFYSMSEQEWFDPGQHGLGDL